MPVVVTHSKINGVNHISGAMQSCFEDSQDENVLRIKGSGYFKHEFLPPVEEVTEIDPKDKNTPDDWVPRHPELIRLTGRHPFNVEPPPTRLFDHGFITPASLHYVRNHGPVPALSFDAHKLVVGGCVDSPAEFSMEWLRSGILQEVTIPVTLVCAGNRRKEENMVRQGLGFSWGPAAASTAIWTGVWLRDLLSHVGIRDYKEGAHHVCMVGSDKLPNGYYGSSIRREVAMDPSADVLLAYKMNGDELSPDHGYPIRVIIPGYIGGRMIKWLKEIMVTSSESDNHYHFFDNRVLPPGVDAERALSEGWWYKPQYIINELNINSTVVYPRHDEVVTIGGPQACSEYKLTGYAYAGGGLPITRVEVSFDGGNVWELANVLQPEKPRHMGKYWCWSFWEYKVDMMRMLNCSEIRCRAWQGQNTQPKDLTWNLLGMMNNCHFRVMVHPCRDDSGYLALRFEHPTQAGPLPGGWMAKAEEAIKVIETKKAAAPKKDASPTYTATELGKHADEKDCWIAIEDKVYDVTSFLSDHPGGGTSIMLCAGQDATDEFNSLHSVKARAMLDKYYIGDLVADDEAAPLPPKSETIHVQKPTQPVALNPRQKIKVTLSEREELTHNTRRFRFALPTPNHKLGLPVGQHLFISGKWKGEFVMRAYTPVTGNEVDGYVDLVVKIYRPNERFPEGGKMSQLLDSLKIGDSIDMKGPLGEIEYKGFSEFIIHDKPRKVTKLGMIAGGTGVTPMYQVAKYILSNPDDKTEVWLLLANQSEDDILLKNDLDALAAAHPNQFHVHYTVDKVVGDYTNWAYSVGFVTEDMIRRNLPKFTPDTITFMCGPPGMIKFACIPNLEKLGYNDQHYFSF